MKTWMVVASAARARVFEASGRQTPWMEVLDLVNASDRMQTQDFVSDKPGRATDAARGQRHTLGNSLDPKEDAAVDFAESVVDKLKDGLREKRFEDLCIVSPPHFLGLLRGRMDKHLAATVKKEVNKDLTREDSAALQAHVSQLLWA